MDPLGVVIGHGQGGRPVSTIHRVAFAHSLDKVAEEAGMEAGMRASLRSASR